MTQRRKRSTKELMAAADLQERTEQDRIEEWRREELERAGYPSDAAGELAVRHDIDLHGAVELVERGCPPEIATRILL
jgi:hypothetical protein